MLALRPQRKAIQAISLSNCVKTIPPPRQEFVHIALVTHVPQEFVLRCRENLMHRDRQLNHAQIRPQVPTGLGQLGDQLLTHLVSQLQQLLLRQLLDVFRPLNHVQVAAL